MACHLANISKVSSQPVVRFTHLFVHTMHPTRLRQRVEAILKNGIKTQ
jgi:hypothetical protein